MTNYNPTAPIHGVGNDTSAATAAYIEEWGGYFQQPAFAFYNPVAAIEQNTLDGTKKEIIASIKTDFQPVDWLKFGVFYSQEREMTCMEPIPANIACTMPHGAINQAIIPDLPKEYRRPVPSAV